MAKKPILDPLLDPPVTPADVSALASLFLGTATEDQQRRALDWILLRACQANASTFHADPLISAYLQGRRQVALMIRNAARTTAKAVTVLEDINKESDE